MKKLLFLDSRIYFSLESLLYSLIPSMVDFTFMSVGLSPAISHCFSSNKLIVVKTFFRIPSYSFWWYSYNHKSSTTMKIIFNPFLLTKFRKGLASIKIDRTSFAITHSPSSFLVYNSAHS